MTRPRRPKAPEDPSALLLAAIEELAGEALVLDEDLRIVGATPGTPALLGEAVPLGMTAPKALCGGAVERPIAEGLAKGVPVRGTVSRPIPGGGERRLDVRATPITRDGRARGWVLLLEDAGTDTSPDAPVRFHGMWTRDPAMKRVFHIVERAARRDVSVLVRGETGTGKELVARAIHALSPRAKGPFRAVNCAALPPNLLESELFGHVRGAFTGAVRDHAGFFRAADHGTLFLDEVAELPLDLQAKLLRVLETKTVVPVGGSDPVKVDVRIVTATHQPLRQLAAEGRFRADLVYRLRVVPIFLPPLRKRVGDVRLLVDQLVTELNAHEGRRIERVSPRAREVLERYAWPGNVRELRNALEYAYVIGEGPVLVEGDLPPEIVDPGAVGEAGLPAANVPPTLPAAEDAERARLERVLERAGGNRERAARMLGISRVTLWRRLKAHGIAETE